MKTTHQLAEEAARSIWNHYAFHGTEETATTIILAAIEEATTELRNDAKAWELTCKGKEMAYQKMEQQSRAAQASEVSHYRQARCAICDMPLVSNDFIEHSGNDLVHVSCKQVIEAHRTKAEDTPS